ncbi:MAG: ATP-binding protein [Silicimonas sp.]
MRELLASLISRAGGRGFVLFLGFLALSVYCVWLLSSDARQQLNKLATAPGDNLQWTLAQLEVEYGALRTASIVASPDDPASLDDLRRRFNILYSRVTIIDTARAFLPVRTDPGVAEAMSRVTGFLDANVDLIDGPDDRLAANLDEFRREIDSIGSDVRMTTLVGVKVYSEMTETNRERAAAAMFDLAMLILFLVLLLLGLVVVLAHVLAITRRQTDEIEQTRSRLGSIVGTSLDAVVVVDRDGRIVEFNDAATRIFGYARDAAMGQNMSDLIVPPHLRKAHTEGMTRHKATGRKRMIDSGLFQLEAMRNGGEVFPVEMSISTARSAEGEIYISFIRDISDRVAAEKELVEARDRAVLGEKAKADLLAVMSHEMRTPLNGILGTLDLLESTDLDRRQRHFVEVMETSGQMLLRHVNDVLDVSRMDADTSAPMRAPFDLAEVVRSVAISLGSQAVARGNKLDVKILGPLPDLVTGDQGRIEQVLVNLAGNAVKFTENGSITIEVEATPESDQVEIRVIDTGAGISERDIGRIFDDFVTLDASYTRSTEGTGLGLGIARRLVEILGGEIGVESEEGQGSVFWVRLPLPPAGVSATRRTPDRPVATPDARGRRVLLVEDNEINRLVAREMLLGLGCIVEEAVDGVEGVELAGLKRFDLILMDISMPRLDGVLAARQIRGGSGPNRSTPIVALTAHTMPEDIQRFRDTGFRSVLIKPLSRRRLAEAVSGSFGQSILAGADAGDSDELDDILGGEAATRVRGKAIAEIMNSLEEVDARLSGGARPGDVYDAVHRMTGLCALVGLTDTHKRLTELEDHLRRDGAVDICGLVADVRASLRTVTADA